MSKKPNVLFLLSDEHSFRHMSFRSQEKEGEPVDTPNLDNLAKNGVFFDKAYCQMPLCTPSRMSILSGKEVRNCGAWSNGAVMRDNVKTFAHDFLENGYETCLVGKMHFGGDRQFNGFKYRPYGDLTGKTGHQWEPIKSDGNPIRGMRERTSTAGTTSIPESIMQEQMVIRESMSFLREHKFNKPDKPWLLTASFSRPHFPLNAPGRYFNKYWPNKVTEPKVGFTGDTVDHPMTEGMREGFRTDEISKDEEMKARAAYFANVEYLDEIIGDFLHLMKKEGFLENTIIVYTSDHGELAGEHGLWWKNSWHEAATRVPFIIQTPEHRHQKLESQIINTSVGLTDIYPTLCSYCDIDIPEDIDGQNLWPAIKNEKEPDSVPVYCDALFPRWGEGTEFRMIRKDNYKYIGFRDAPEILFDLKNDPLEQNNLVQSSNKEIKDVLNYFRNLMEKNMDFDAAEEERKEDNKLHKTNDLEIPRGSGNCYLMPDGRLVNADDPLYDPTVLTENPEDIFDDWPDT